MLVCTPPSTLNVHRVKDGQLPGSCTNIGNLCALVMSACMLQLVPLRCHTPAPCMIWGLGYQGPQNPATPKSHTTHNMACHALPSSYPA